MGNLVSGRIQKRLDYPVSGRIQKRPDYPAGYPAGRIPGIQCNECIPIVYYDTACIKIRKKNQGSNAEEIKISRNNHNTGTGNLKVKRKALMA
jgi:hypothetical protein